MLAIHRALREGRIGWKSLPRDALAGVVVGIVAIPLAMAFAIASGVTPQQGLMTGVVAGVLVSLLGGSQVQIAGPTGAFVVILGGIVAKHGVSGLLVSTMLAGAILVALGLARLGNAIRYIPHPVTVGFTAGIAVVIFTGQVADFLGLRLAESPQEFVGKVEALVRAAPTASLHTAVVAALTLGVCVFFPRVTKRVPSPLVGMLAATFLLAALGWGDVATIGSRFGEIPSTWPPPSIPAFDGHRLATLLPAAFSIAMLGAIESLLSAVVADGMTGDAHDSNQELVAQGVANVVTPLFGGFAATGAIARTATNVRNGGRSPVAGVVHAGVLVVTILFLSPYASHVPLASLAAILFVVAWNMSERHAVLGLLRHGSAGDRLVLVATFALTVFVDLIVAVQVGVVLAALLFMKHMAERTDVKALVAAPEGADPFHDLAAALPSEIAVYAVDGPLFFGVSHRFESTVAAVDATVKIVVLRLWKVPYLDSSGLHALERAVHALKRRGRVLLVAGVRPEVRSAIEKAGLLREIGEDRVWSNLEEALAAARELLVDLRLAAARAGR